MINLQDIEQRQRDNHFRKLEAAQSFKLRLIAYPTKVNESEIQAELWGKLKAKGYDARLEVIVYSEKLRGKVRNKSILDIVLFKNHQAIGIIECKSWSKSYLRNRKYQECRNTKQLKKYQGMFQLPLFVCGCLKSIEPAVHFASALYSRPT